MKPTDSVQFPEPPKNVERGATDSTVDCAQRLLE